MHPGGRTRHDARGGRRDCSFRASPDHRRAIGPRAEEVEDKELLDVPITTADVLLIDAKLAGTTLGDASKEDWTRGLYLRQLSRGGQEIPVATGVVLQRGDMLRIVGPEPVVQKAAARIGAIVAPSAGIDFVVLGLAIFLGGVVGVLVTFPSATSKSRWARASARCWLDFWSVIFALSIRCSGAFPTAPSPS